MSFSEKFLRAQLNLSKPFMNDSSLEFVRRGQNRLGELMAMIHKRDVYFENVEFSDFTGAWAYPRDEVRDGAVLYLHGGGYTCGTLEYAKGFGATIAAKCGTRVFCAAYRLAPEYPFPAALDDALCAYEYLISSGYSPNNIVLCGESAGGGLIYALCLKLKQLGRELPAGLIAISPWSDLAASGESYEINKNDDPSMEQARLDFFAKCYCKDRLDPLVSPLFGDLCGMPPSLIFVGGDEIMLDDSRLLHEKLLSLGSKSTLVVAKNMWHAYVLYGLKDRECDMEQINDFLRITINSERKLRWLKLDNAAKIYPAARRKTWTNMYRVSATLCDKIDESVLESALDVTVRRFPSIAVRVKAGVFWYYLEEVPNPPKIERDHSYPLTHFPFSKISKCAFRVLYYENRIAVELFHALTDGNGAIIFLKALVAEYITQKYGAKIPCTNGVLSRTEKPKSEELEDSFPKYSGDISKSRSESNAYHLPGTKEPDGFMHVTTFMASVDDIRAKAHEYGVTVNTFFVAAFMMAIMNIQKDQGIPRKRRKPVKVLVPVNLRKVFDSKTLRNFAMFVTPEIDPRLGEYTFSEICGLVHHQIGFMVNKKEMASRITPNMAAEKQLLLKIMPLFIKNIAMKAVYDAVGERKSCICMSNLGLVELPDEMKEYVKRMDFVLGVQATCPCNCGILAYDGKIYLNFIRNITEPHLEMSFYEVLRDLGIEVEVESNER